MAERRMVNRSISVVPAGAKIANIQECRVFRRGVACVDYNGRLGYRATPSPPGYKSAEAATVTPDADFERIPMSVRDGRWNSLNSGRLYNTTVDRFAKTTRCP